MASCPLTVQMGFTKYSRVSEFAFGGLMGALQVLPQRVQREMLHFVIDRISQLSSRDVKDLEKLLSMLFQVPSLGSLVLRDLPLFYAFVTKILINLKLFESQSVFDSLSAFISTFVQSHRWAQHSVSLSPDVREMIEAATLAPPPLVTAEYAFPETKLLQTLSDELIVYAQTNPLDSWQAELAYLSALVFVIRREMPLPTAAVDRIVRGMVSDVTIINEVCRCLFFFLAHIGTPLRKADSIVAPFDPTLPVDVIIDRAVTSVRRRLKDVAFAVPSSFSAPLKLSEALAFPRGAYSGAAALSDAFGRCPSTWFGVFLDTFVRDTMMNDEASENDEVVETTRSFIKDVIGPKLKKAQLSRLAVAFFNLLSTDDLLTSFNVLSVALEDASLDEAKEAKLFCISNFIVGILRTAMSRPPAERDAVFGTICSKLFPSFRVVSDKYITAWCQAVKYLARSRDLTRVRELIDESFTLIDDAVAHLKREATAPPRSPSVGVCLLTYILEKCRVPRSDVICRAFEAINALMGNHPLMGTLRSDLSSLIAAVWTVAAQHPHDRMFALALGAIAKLSADVAESVRDGHIKAELGSPAAHLFRSRVELFYDVIESTACDIQIRLLPLPTIEHILATFVRLADDPGGGDTEDVSEYMERVLAVQTLSDEQNEAFMRILSNSIVDQALSIKSRVRAGTMLTLRMGVIVMATATIDSCLDAIESCLKDPKLVPPPPSF